MGCVGGWEDVGRAEGRRVKGEARCGLWGEELKC